VRKCSFDLAEEINEAGMADDRAQDLLNDRAALTLAAGELNGIAVT
jgi:hypothetical protein